MENTNEQEINKKRPVFLTVLGILSFITIGFGLLGNVTGIFSGPLSEKEMNQAMAEALKSLEPLNASGMDDMSASFELVFRTQVYINANFYVHTLITIASFLIGLLGVIFMFKGRKNGFHLYIIYNLINVSSIYLSVPASEVPSIIVISNLIFSALFVFLYSRNLHWMK
jgi:hypothetical protein